MRERLNNVELSDKKLSDSSGTFPARVDSGAAKTRKELGKTGKKQETENLAKPYF
jgi:hypothetical protein